MSPHDGFLDEAALWLVLSFPNNPYKCYVPTSLINYNKICDQMSRQITEIVKELDL